MRVLTFAVEEAKVRKEKEVKIANGSYSRQGASVCKFLNAINGFLMNGVFTIMYK